MKPVIEIDEISYAEIQYGKPISAKVMDALIHGKVLPKGATNGQTFINVFGIDAWKQMIEFSNLNEQFREFWNAPYKADKEKE